MLVLKFGGTSVGDADAILKSVTIVKQRATTEKIAVVVSAIKGVSDLLDESIRVCCQRNDMIVHYENKIREIHEKVIQNLQKQVSGFEVCTVLKTLQSRFIEYHKLLESICVTGECGEAVRALIMSEGEYLNVEIIAAILRYKGVSITLCDSRNYIYCTGNRLEGDVDYEYSKYAFAKIRNESQENQVLLFPGFVCSWTKNLKHNNDNNRAVAGLLGRNGSDISAAVIACILQARRVEFFSDVDGVFTADPRVVNDAILIPEISYEEAIELSFFGSKVLHPKTLSFLCSNDIEAVCLNTFNLDSNGTRIGKKTSLSCGTVQGITCLKHIAMLSVSGVLLKGKAGIASRIFGAASRAKVSILLITQSSSEYTISLCVNETESNVIKDAIEDEFSLEIHEGIVNSVEVNHECSIVSIVGDSMKKHTGVAATFFNALASREINIFAIAQGAQERSISAVVNEQDGDTAVRIAHRFFFNTMQTIELFIFGTGAIGTELLSQIAKQKQELLQRRIDVKVIAVANSKKMIINPDGLELVDLKIKLEQSTITSDINTILQIVKETKPLNPVFVDCTASQILPDRYLDILATNMHIATPNKKANSMSMEFYRKLRTYANKSNRRFLYETNVGAGLPIIDTLQNMFKSGDKFYGFEGIMSGSLSYIFGRLDEGITFSEAVKQARNLRFTEPDPRDDLKGIDVARKALIIAREAGLVLELNDIKLESIFPNTFDTSGSVDDFMARLSQIDEYFTNKVKCLKTQYKTLRMGAKIVNGHCMVGIIEASNDSPLASVKGGENAFVFHTMRYSPIPLTIRGYGAGVAVTAAGVFGDILRTVSFN